MRRRRGLLPRSRDVKVEAHGDVERFRNLQADASQRPDVSPGAVHDHLRKTRTGNKTKAGKGRHMPDEHEGVRSHTAPVEAFLAAPV